MADVEERLRDIELGLTELKTKQAADAEANKSEQDRQRRFTERIVIALLALVAILSGKEAVLNGLGHTPPLQIAQYALIAIFYSLFLLYLFYQVMVRGGNKWLLLVSLVLFGIAAFVRLGEGVEFSNKFSLAMSVPYILAAFTLLNEVIARWNRR